MKIVIKHCHNCKKETVWESVNSDSPLICRTCKKEEDKKPIEEGGFSRVYCKQAPTDKRH